MPRVATLSNPRPYNVFGTFAGLPFWPGGLTLLAAAPGVGKTSWLLRMVHEASASGFPAALGCYEHSAEELHFRLRLQCEAATSGAHASATGEIVERELARSGSAVLLALQDSADTIRSIEEALIEDFGFPKYGPALVAIDYLQRVPVLGLTGLVPEERRGGEAAVALRGLGRKRGWAIIAASALRLSAFASTEKMDLNVLLGDERVSYEPDRVVAAYRKQTFSCGCATLSTQILKDRTGSIREWPMEFWGARFYPVIEGDIEHGPLGDTPC